MTNFIYQFGSLLTRLLNIFLGGDASMTTSARAYIMEQEGFVGWGYFRRLIDALLSPFEANHCERTWRNRADRAQETIERNNEI